MVLCSSLYAQDQVVIGVNYDQFQKKFNYTLVNPQSIDELTLIDLKLKALDDHKQLHFKGSNPIPVATYNKETQSLLQYKEILLSEKEKQMSEPQLIFISTESK
jgi:hypothetical protein